MKVKELMTSDPAVCTLNSSLHDVAKLMAEFDCGCIPVVESDEEKAPIGTITDRDISLRTVAHNKNPLNMIAGEVMTDRPVTITPDASIEDACGLMEGNRIRRLVVIDEKGDLLGMLSQADVARFAPQSETAHLVKEVSVNSQKMTA